MEEAKVVAGEEEQAETVTEEQAEAVAEEQVVTVAEDIGSWGIGLIVMGILHFYLDFLSAEWGMVLIPIGVLCLAVRHRGMYILLGLALMLVGVLNVTDSIQGGMGFWPVFGFMQVYWGFQEIAKFWKSAEATEEGSFEESLEESIDQEQLLTSDMLVYGQQRDKTIVA